VKNSGEARRPTSLLFCLLSDESFSQNGMLSGLTRVVGESTMATNPPQGKLPGEAAGMIPELFRTVDKKDTAKFVSFLAPECVFRFGNSPAVQGRENVGHYVGGFFDSIHSLSHDLTNVWGVHGGIVCHGHVSYTRKDNAVLTVPFRNVFKVSAACIAEYTIFADVSMLYS
jgi:hypothetical protein